MRDFIYFLFRPSWWIVIDPVCLGLDLRINKAIDHGFSVSRVSEYTVRFDGLVIWVANHPFASVSANGVTVKRSTRKRFFEYMNLTLDRYNTQNKQEH